jgi:hypothetical protein
LGLVSRVRFSIGKTPTVCLDEFDMVGQELKVAFFGTVFGGPLSLFKNAYHGDLRTFMEIFFHQLGELIEAYCFNPPRFIFAGFEGEIEGGNLDSVSGEETFWVCPQVAGENTLIQHRFFLLLDINGMVC